MTTSSPSPSGSPYPPSESAAFAFALSQQHLPKFSVHPKAGVDVTEYHTAAPDQPQKKDVEREFEKKNEESLRRLGLGSKRQLPAQIRPISAVPSSSSSVVLQPYSPSPYGSYTPYSMPLGVASPPSSAFMPPRPLSAAEFYAVMEEKENGTSPFIYSPVQSPLPAFPLAPPPVFYPTASISSSPVTANSASASPTPLPSVYGNFYPTMTPLSDAGPSQSPVAIQPYSDRPQSAMLASYVYPPTQPSQPYSQPQSRPESSADHHSPLQVKSPRPRLRVNTFNRMDRGVGGNLSHNQRPQTAQQLSSSPLQPDQSPYPASPRMPGNNPESMNYFMQQQQFLSRQPHAQRFLQTQMPDSSSAAQSPIATDSNTSSHMTLPPQFQLAIDHSAAPIDLSSPLASPTDSDRLRIETPDQLLAWSSDSPLIVPGVTHHPPISMPSHGNRVSIRPTPRPSIFSSTIPALISTNSSKPDVIDLSAASGILLESQPPPIPILGGSANSSRPPSAPFRPKSNATSRRPSAVARKQKQVQFPMPTTSRPPTAASSVSSNETDPARPQTSPVGDGSNLPSNTTTRPTTANTTRPGTAVPPSLLMLAPPPSESHYRIQAMLLANAEAHAAGLFGKFSPEQERAHIQKLIAAKRAKEQARREETERQMAERLRQEQAEMRAWKRAKKEAMQAYRAQQAYQKRQAEKARRQQLEEMGLAEGDEDQTATGAKRPTSAKIPDALLRVLKEQELIERCDAELKAATEKIEADAQVMKTAIDEDQVDQHHHHHHTSLTQQPPAPPSTMTHKKQASSPFPMTTTSTAVVSTDSTVGSNTEESKTSSSQQYHKRQASNSSTLSNLSNLSSEKTPRATPNLTSFNHKKSSKSVSIASTSTSMVTFANADPTPKHRPSSATFSFLISERDRLGLNLLDPSATEANIEDDQYFGYDYAYGNSVKEQAYDAPQVLFASADQIVSSAEGRRSPHKLKHPSSAKKRSSPSPSRPKSPHKRPSSGAQRHHRSRSRTSDPLVASALRVQLAAEAVANSSEGTTASSSSAAPKAPVFQFQKHRIVPYVIPGMEGGGAGGINGIIAPVTVKPVRVPEKSTPKKSMFNPPAPVSPSHPDKPSFPSTTVATPSISTSSPSKPLPRAFALASQEFARQADARQSRRTREEREAREKAEQANEPQAIGTQVYQKTTSTVSALISTTVATASPNPAKSPASSLPATPMIEETEVASESSALDTLGVPAWQLTSGMRRPPPKSGPRLMHSDRRAMAKASKNPLEVLLHNDPLTGPRVSAAGGVGKEQATTWHQVPITFNHAHHSNEQVIHQASNVAAGVDRDLVERVFRHIPAPSPAMNPTSPNTSMCGGVGHTCSKCSHPHHRARRPSSIFGGPPVAIGIPTQTLSTSTSHLQSIRQSPVERATITPIPELVLD